MYEKMKNQNQKSYMPNAAASEMLSDGEFQSYQDLTPFRPENDDKKW